MRIAAVLVSLALSSVACASPTTATDDTDVSGTELGTPVAPATTCNGLWHIDRASFERNALRALDFIHAAQNDVIAFAGRPGIVTFDYEPAATCTIRALSVDELPSSWPGSAGRNADNGDIEIVQAFIYDVCQVAPVDPRRPCSASVLAHELLHGLGVGHLAAGVPGVMAPLVAEMSGQFTAADRELCVAAKVCAAKALGE